MGYGLWVVRAMKVWGKEKGENGSYLGTNHGVCSWSHGGPVYKLHTPTFDRR